MAKYSKAVALATQYRNDCTEYAIREDGIVFAREGFFDNFNGHWAKTRWTACSQQSHTDGVATQIIESVNQKQQSVAIGFASKGHHLLITEGLRLRLPLKSEEIYYYGS